MKWTNYHTHSQYCDGKEELSAYVEEAIKKGFPAIGFSGHAPMPFYTEWTIKQENFADYLEEVQELKVEYKDKIQVYSGLEIDYIKELTGVEKFKDCKLDYTIGSVHFLGSFPNGEYFGIDHTGEKFERGLQGIFFGDIQELVIYYYRKINEMIASNPPDVIGHFDIIKKFNLNNRFFNENDNWYRDTVSECLNQVAKTGCIVEINTRGVFKKLCDDFYPSHWILQRCKQLKIPVMINGDAHHPSEIDSLFVPVAQKLKQIGFTEVSVFLDQKWKQVGFTENGLLI